MINLIFEDNHLFVINKPAGLMTQPSGTSQDNAEMRAKAWIKEHYQKPGNVFLHAVHRLDKPASGIVLFAKTSKALSRLNASIRSKNTRKVYQAVVTGNLFASEGVLENFLIHDDFKASVVTSRHPQAKQARLFFRVIDRQEPFTLVEIELETGRYHQIRAQLAAVGCPIVGDYKYGSKDSYAEEAIALHHEQLDILHPTTEDLVRVYAPLPLNWPFHSRSGDNQGV